MRANGSRDAHPMLRDPERRFPHIATVHADYDRINPRC